MRRTLILGISMILPVATGCVVVNPSGDVHFTPSSWKFWEPSPPPTQARTAYAPHLQRVVHQQEKIVKVLNKRQWDSVVDEATDWTEYVRVLSGYADTTHDPARMRRYCDQLLAQIRSLRSGALTRNVTRCDQSLQACDPILNALTRDFPTTVPLVPARPEPSRPAPGPSPSQAP